MKRAGNKIKYWMSENNLKMVDIEREIQISHSLVSDTIHGKRNNRRVLQALLDAGCPAKMLDLPADMKSKQAA
ncbi:MAG TPA: XRE family transcriptional regulator [Solidesulfovibrio sp.]|nr:DNA-binding protein [Desulfovibrio sp.]HML61585.1 XRE family transcriptional regulator [Solidesulfovibrio sp.]